VDRVSIERMCAGREFQVEDADAEKAREQTSTLTNNSNPNNPSRNPKVVTL